MYRVELRSPNMHFTYNCKTIEEFKDKITRITEDFGKNSAWYNWHKPVVTDEEYELVESIFAIISDSTLKNSYATRREHRALTFYTNDMNLVNRLHSIQQDAKINTVRPMPEGIIEFKREPPAAYRVFLRSCTIPCEIKTQILDYLMRTPDVQPSDALYKWLNTTNKYGAIKCWTWSSHYFDYSDINNLLMMKLIFPEIIGKNYRLEKKP